MFAPFTATPLRFAPDHLAIVAGTKGSTAGRCRIGGDDGQRNLRMRIIIPDDIHRGEQNAREQRAPDPVAKRDQPAQQGRDEGEHRHYRHIKPIHGRQIDGHRLLLLATRNPFSLSDAAAPREIKLRARKAAMPSSHVAQPCRPATSPSHATETMPPLAVPRAERYKPFSSREPSNASTCTLHACAVSENLLHGQCSHSLDLARTGTQSISGSPAPAFPGNHDRTCRSPFQNRALYRLRRCARHLRPCCPVRFWNPRPSLNGF